MDLGSIFLILALLLLVGLFISRPFFEKQALVQDLTPEEHQLSALLAERDRILNALQELDFDSALGKIPEEDYPAQRAMLMTRGADILRQLDNLQPESEAETAEARLEAAIAARRADAAREQAGVAAGTNGRKLGTSRGVATALAAPDDELEALLSDRRRTRQEKSAGFCPHCGGALQKSDRFCPKCGGKI